MEETQKPKSSTESAYVAAGSREGSRVVWGSCAGSRNKPYYEVTVPVSAAPVLEQVYSIVAREKLQMYVQVENS